MKNLPDLEQSDPIANDPILSPSSESTSAADGAHLDAIVLADDAGQGEGAGGDPATEAGLLTPEQFYETIAGGLELAGQLTALESLPIAQGEAGGARRATDAIYATVLEMPWLHWLIKPGNIYIQRAMVVLAFVGPKSRMVKAELAERRRAALAAKAAKSAGAPARPAPGVPPAPGGLAQFAPEV